MNLYGENGNIRILEEFIKRQHVEAEISKLTIGDEIDFKAYDFFYIGAGSEEAEKMVLNDLMDYKKSIKEAVEDGKMFLVTGNSMEIFGQKIRFKSDASIECLGLFDYSAFQANDRLVSEIFYKFETLEEGKGRDFVAFKNCGKNIVNNEEEKLFKFSDSFRHGNFFGMMLVGPVLVRNPYFTDYLLEILFTYKGYIYERDDSTIEYTAYRKFIENFITNDNLD